MFGAPHIPTDKDSIFYLVWTYTIKALDGQKKAWCVCDDSSQAGLACILDEVYANCVDQTGSRLFYTIAAGKNLLILGADVTNAFVEAPLQKQGVFIYPNQAFLDWWVHHKKNPTPPARRCHSNPIRNAGVPRVPSPLGEACQ
jgi:hypothetical protein